MTERYSVEERRADIISAGVRIANKKGFGKINPRNVAEECVLPITKRLIVNYFSMAVLRKIVAEDKRLEKNACHEAMRLGLRK